MTQKRGVSTQRSASTGSFTNGGGPVVANPVVQLIFWGSSWNVDSAHQLALMRLQQFLTDLTNSSLMNLLAQYGVGSASVLPMAFVDTKVTGTLTDAGIQAQLQTYFTNGLPPEPDANRVHMIFLDESVAENDPGNGLVLCEPSGDTAFGYHNFFTTQAGNPCYYAIVPALDDACVTESCSGSSGCTLSLSDSQEQRRTEVATHEFSEMVTDPQLNAWTDSQGNEIGDVCAGVDGNIAVGANTWKVQQEWDNNANACGLGSSPVPNPPPPVPPPPPGNTSSSDVVIVNLLAYGIARLLGRA